MKLVQRTGEWASELYDLEIDPGEAENRIDAPLYRDRLHSLRADLTRFFASAGAPPLEEWRSTTTQELTVYSRD
ncbi:MAG: hypothetical protein ACK5AZ_18120 [Bryobacteraceae bacterium]